MIYREPRWYYRHDLAALVRNKAEETPPGYMAEIEIEIPFHQIPGLIQALEENGLLKPRLDERLRTEDLRITHRLMDLLGQAIGK